MKVYRDFKPGAVACGLRSAVTLGTFDGVHVGHGRIIARVLERARQNGLDAVVVTFDRHPSVVLRGDTAPGLLTTLEEKLELFREYGLDRVYIMQFTPETSRIPADTFIRDYLGACLGMRFFVVGYDHGFGHNREISTETLREYARELEFELEITDPVVDHDVVVKSSTIRALIRRGDVHTASVFLGRDYSIGGRVVHGAGLGRQIGLPTANLEPESPEKILPGHGVYAGWADIGSVRRMGVISVGPRPTFDAAEETIEIHLPDYSGDLYNSEMRIGFSRKLRDIVKYDTREALVARIRQDIEEARQFNIS